MTTAKALVFTVTATNFPFLRYIVRQGYLVITPVAEAVSQQLHRPSHREMECLFL